MHVFSHFLALAAFSSTLAFGADAQAQTLAEPGGPTVLTVTGNIAATNVGDTAQFDMDMLRELGGHEIETSTIWTDGTHLFTGVSLQALLSHLGAEGEVIEASAINDYKVEIPIEDATEDGPIIAYELDGAPMPRRERGPLWVIYPFDADAKFRTEVIYSRSIWQLDRIEIVD